MNMTPIPMTMPVTTPMTMPVHVIATSDELEQTQFATKTVIEALALPLVVTWTTTEIFSNKALKQLVDKDKSIDKTEDNTVDKTVLLAHHKNNALQLTMVQTHPDGKLIKTALDWHKLQRRVVTAGRKSELLLQPCKLSAGMSVLDATAGFGHDSLILASTGASVMMMERHPIMALMLRLEQLRMSVEKNWQRLMGRLDIRFGDMREIPEFDNSRNFDVVYLDPMFPDASFDAKVGKEMQMLHILADPPQLLEEKQLLQQALSLIHDEGRVVVKRPLSASNLANIKPLQTVANDAIRFDIYHD